LPYLQDREKGFALDGIDGSYAGEWNLVLARFWKGEVSRKLKFGHYLANPPCLAALLEYGLMELDYDPADIVRCEDPNEAAGVYAQYQKALGAFDSFIRKNGATDLKTDEAAAALFLEIKKPFFRLMSTYACHTDGNAMSKLGLENLNKAMSASGIGGSIGNVNEGLFEELLKEWSYRVPGTGRE
jgi:hypothetical protein